MKILAIYRHYWPDATPYAQILRMILEHLAASGHEVSVLTAQPSYNDVQAPKQPWKQDLGGVAVRRLRLLPERKRLAWLRLVNTLLFLARAVVCVLLGRRNDLIIANVHPPVLMGLTLRLLKRLTGTDYILHCMDIHPEASSIVGRIRDGWLYRRLRAIDTKNYLRARKVVALSTDMANALVERGLPRDKITLINNPPLPLESERPGRLPDEMTDDPNVYYVLFAGNLGLFQGLDSIVNAAKILVDQPQIRFVFMGEGLAKPRMQELAGDQCGNQIVFLPYQPAADAWAVMQRADLAVVSLLPDMIRYSYPSKLMTYLSAGCRLLAVVENDSELAKTVEDHHLGYVARDFTVGEIAAGIRTAWSEREQWTAERRSANEMACTRLFGRERMLRAWTELITSLAQDMPDRNCSPPHDYSRYAA